MFEAIYLSQLKPCPSSGKGVHRWICHAVHKALEWNIPEWIATPIIEERITRDQNPPNEIEATFRNLRRDREEKRASRSTYWPKVNQKQIKTIAAAGPTLLQLWQSSPFPLKGDESLAEEIIDILFPGNPLLCVGRSQSFFHTRHREQWRGMLQDRQFIVPSPMTAVRGITKGGKLSEHTLDNTGPRRFLVIEFDEGGFDQHAAVLHHLGTKAPLALVVYSASKSLHGWFPCSGQPEERIERLMQYAVSLGADPATWTRSQFVRMPDGRREEIKPNRIPLPQGFRPVPPDRQAVVYFNPEVIQ